MRHTELKKNAFKIVHRLRENGFKTYIVGGAVRDIALGIEPKDYDIVTEASPEQVAELFGRTYPVGAQYGVSVVTMGDKSYEVARFRTDGVYEDGRRPSSIGTAGVEEDAQRRDFTINALLYDPDLEKIIDYVSGTEDIKNGIIRTVGDPSIRFTEDRLRMLRAVRFAARFDYEIEPETFAALQQYAPEIVRVSPERIGEELSKMFSGKHPDKALILLDKSGLLDIVLPEVSAMKEVEQPPEFHPEGDVYTHTHLMLQLYEGGSVTLGFGILFHDIGKPVTCSKTDRIRFNRHSSVGAEIAGTILRRYRFSNSIISKVQALVKNHMRFMHVPRMKQSTRRRFMAQDNFNEMLELFRIDCLASHGNLETYNLLLQEIEKVNRGKNSLQLPESLINGDDLTTLGYEPGPLYGTMLHEVFDAQLEGEVSTKEEAIAFVLRRFPR